MKRAPKEIAYTGGTITEPGIYTGISLDQYHEDRDLFDGPSVSKSALKWLLPTHGGSPKAFWGRWKWNPDHIVPKSTEPLRFGRAVHCLLLGDEVFEDRFVVRPATYPDAKTGSPKPWNANSNWCKAWLDEHKHLTVVTPENIETIRRMAADADAYPLVQMGALNGKIERTLAWKDPETRIWIKARPDSLTDDGIFVDLKTASKFDEDFLSKQVFDACYYLQGAMTWQACRGLGLPFETFALLYVLNDDVPDTTHAELDDADIAQGTAELRWCLRTIRSCLDAGEWPGARPFAGGEVPVRMKPWARESIDRFLNAERALEAA